MPDPIQTWRTVFREGFAPILPTHGLEYVAELLRNDSPELIQGATADPPPITVNQQEAAEAACFLGACGIGNGCRTVGEVERFFSQACSDADQRIGQLAACGWFLNWFDDTPRDEMRRELLAEVEQVLATRKVGAA